MTLSDLGPGAVDRTNEREILDVPGAALPQVSGRRSLDGATFMVVPRNGGPAIHELGVYSNVGVWVAVNLSPSGRTDPIVTVPDAGGVPSGFEATPAAADQPTPG
ncbi:hypothetical protein HBB16_04390 [Pseudonocardia sp. MCCB 268]|nr:hypothetical protein [Pseudonocardia cytotoxica]